MFVKRFFLILMAIIWFPLSPVYAYNDSNGYIVQVKENRRFMRSAIVDCGVEEIGVGKGLYFAETQNDIAKLRTLGEIEYIEPNYTVTLFSEPNDDYYIDQSLIITEVCNMPAQALNINDAHNTEYPTTYREVKIGKMLYRVTGVFKGEVELKNALEDLAVRRVLCESENASDTKI